MFSSFNTSRIFSDSTGWYVVMRESDCKNLISAKYQLIGNQHMMGPFSSKNQVEEWLNGYLSMHSQNRNENEAEYLPDSVDTHH